MKKFNLFAVAIVCLTLLFTGVGCDQTLDCAQICGDVQTCFTGADKEAKDACVKKCEKEEFKDAANQCSACLEGKNDCTAKTFSCGTDIQCLKLLIKPAKS